MPKPRIPKEALIFSRVSDAYAKRLARALSLEQTNPITTREGFLLSAGKKPLLSLVMRKIRKNPLLARRIVVDARANYASSLPLLREIETAAMNPAVPMPRVIKLGTDYLVKAHSGAIDRAFNWETFLGEVSSCLRPRSAFRLKREIILSTMAANGLDTYSSFKRTALLHLAEEFGLSSADMAAHPFLDFGWGWYRKNYVPLKERLDALTVTEQEQKRELAELMAIEKIPNGDFHAVIEKLKDMNLEKAERIRARQVAATRLLINAKPHARRVLKAMLYFVGESASLDEEMHITNHKVMNLFLLAAERRGIPQSRILGIFEKETRGLTA